MAGVVCFTPCGRPRFFYRLHLWRGRKGERKSFAWTEYRDVIVFADRQLGAPVVWVWDNVNVHTLEQQTRSAIRAGLQPHACREGVVGLNLKQFYAEAGRLHAYEEQRGMPLVMAVAFEKRPV